LRDLTVLRQIAAHLDGWGGLRARVVTDADWPGVHVTGGPGPGGLLWRCSGQRWAAELLADGGAGGPVATIQTGIGEDASASEVADAIKDLYRLLGTAAGGPGQRPRS
jgi:hypothetical protein